MTLSHLGAVAVPVGCLAFLAVLTACGDAREGAPGGPPSNPPVVRLDTALVIEHERIWYVDRIRIVGDGFLVLAGGSDEILHFDETGRLVRAFGQKGEGPGEFGDARDLVARGDSVWVVDSLLRRISLFVWEEFRDSWSIPAGAGAAERLHVAGDLTIVAAQGPSSVGWVPPGPHFHRTSMEVFRTGVPLDGSWERLLAFRGQERQVTHIRGGMHHSLPPFGTSTSYEVTARGIIGVDHRTGRIALWSWAGEETTVRAGVDSTYVSDRELRRFEQRRDSHLARLTTLGHSSEDALLVSQAAIDRWNGRIPRPVYEDLVSDGELIAVERYNPGDEDPRSWVVLDREGTMLGEFTVPAGVRIRAMDGWTFAAMARDSLDVESILVLRAVR